MLPKILKDGQSHKTITFLQENGYIVEVTDCKSLRVKKKSVGFESFLVPQDYLNDKIKKAEY